MSLKIDLISLLFFLNGSRKTTLTAAAPNLEGKTFLIEPLVMTQAAQTLHFSHHLPLFCHTLWV